MVLDITLRNQKKNSAHGYKGIKQPETVASVDKIPAPNVHPDMTK